MVWMGSLFDIFFDCFFTRWASSRMTICPSLTSHYEEVVMGKALQGAKQAIDAAADATQSVNSGLIGLLQVPGCELRVHIYPQDYTVPSGKVSFKGRVDTVLYFNGGEVDRIRGSYKVFLNGNTQLDFGNSSNADFPNSSRDKRLSSFLNATTVGAIIDKCNLVPKAKDAKPASFHRTVTCDFTGAFVFAEPTKQARIQREMDETEKGFTAAAPSVPVAGAAPKDEKAAKSAAAEALADIE